MRKLKFHEQKLLKKVNFLQWKREGSHRENSVMQRYHVTGRGDYKKYTNVATLLVRLKFAVHLKEAITYIEQGHVRVGPETVTDPAFFVTRNMEDFITWVAHKRRSLATLLVKLKFAVHLKEAITYIKQGHVRVGPETVTDPAFLVTRNMEDLITWVDSSKTKRKVLQYNDKLTDYDTLN